MARLAGLVEVVACFPQLLGASILDDLKDSKADVSQRLDFGIPKHGIGLKLRPGLSGGQFSCVKALAIVLITGRRKEPRNFQEVYTFCQCDCTDSDLLPVLIRLRRPFRRPTLGSLDLDCVKILSAAGSIMSRISSLTDTTGFMSPHRAGAGDEEGFGFDVEHADRKTVTINTPVRATTGVQTKPFIIPTSNDG